MRSRVTSLVRSPGSGVSRHAQVLVGCSHRSHSPAVNPDTLNAVTSEGVGAIGTHCPPRGTGTPAGSGNSLSDARGCRADRSTKPGRVSHPTCTSHGQTASGGASIVTARVQTYSRRYAARTRHRARNFLLGRAPAEVAAARERRGCEARQVGDDRRDLVQELAPSRPGSALAHVRGRHRHHLGPSVIDQPGGQQGRKTRRPSPNGATCTTSRWDHTFLRRANNDGGAVFRPCCARTRCRSDHATCECDERHSMPEAEAVIPI